MSINDIKFPWEYTEEELSNMPDVVGEHGKLIEYRQEAYHDVQVFEDGYIERIYICD